MSSTTSDNITDKCNNEEHGETPAASVARETSLEKSCEDIDSDQEIHQTDDQSHDLPQIEWSPPSEPVVGDRDFSSTIRKEDDSQNVDTNVLPASGASMGLVATTVYENIVTAEMVEVISNVNDTEVTDAIHVDVLTEDENKESEEGYGTYGVQCPCGKFNITRKLMLVILLITIVVVAICILHL
jgi:hypothetical protein